MENEKEESLEELEKKYYKNLSWYFSEKFSRQDSTIRLVPSVMNLTCSTRISKNQVNHPPGLLLLLTDSPLWGVLVAAIGVLVAVVTFIANI